MRKLLIYPKAEATHELASHRAVQEPLVNPKVADPFVSCWPIVKQWIGRQHTPAREPLVYSQVTDRSANY